MTLHPASARIRLMPETLAPTKIPFTSRLDQKTAIALGLGLVGLGIFLGYRLRAGTPDVIEVPSLRREPAAPCADCAERAVQEARRGAHGDPVNPVPVQVITDNGTVSGLIAEDGTVYVAPGDSSVPGDDLE